MNAESGEILAMVSYPTFNPNNPERVIERNKVVDDFFEPGSLIKPVTVAGALKLGHIQKDSVINTNPGFVTLSGLKGGGRGKNFGRINPSETISKSSQVGIAKLLSNFHPAEMRDNLGQFGFGKELKMQWINNSTGKIIDNPKLYDIDKASLGYGYSLTSNSLQIAKAYSVFANEGVMVEPRILPDIQI